MTGEAVAEEHAAKPAPAAKPSDAAENAGAPATVENAVANNNSNAVEIDHLQKLNDRKKELDAREEELNRMEVELQTQKVDLEKTPERS